MASSRSGSTLKLETPAAGCTKNTRIMATILDSDQLFSGLLFIPSLKHHSVLALIFLTLVPGFAGLTADAFRALPQLKIAAAWDLTVCALLA
jgi:succinate-acetate transporter protein